MPPQDPSLPREDYFQTYQSRTPRSAEMHLKSSQVTPGGISHNNRYHVPYPLFFKKAQGPNLWDVDGNTYVDLWMAHYDAILGHAPPELVARLTEAMAQGIHVGLAMEHEVRLADLIVENTPAAEQVRFCTSGTEATMYAVRLARAFTGRNTIIKMVGGWHGANSDLLVDVSPPEFIGLESKGLIPGVEKYTLSAQFNDIAHTQEIIDQAGNDLAAIILEPAIGGIGFVPVEPEYLAFLKKVQQSTGALIIFDEVITGFRLALGSAGEFFNFTPDLVTLGKVIGGGMAIGAIAGRKEILEISSVEQKKPKAEKVVIGGGTYSANPLSMTAGAYTLETLKAGADTIYPALAAANKKLTQGIRNAFEAAGLPVYVTEVGSLHEVHLLKEAGLSVKNMAEMLENTYWKRRTELAGRLRNHGVFMFHAGAISTTHGDEEINKIIEAYAKSAEEMAR